MVCALLHGFSFQMLKHLNCTIDSTELTEAHFNQIKNDCVSVIGIEELANILDVEYNPQFIQLGDGDEFVQVLICGKLEKGVGELPPGVDLKYIHCKIKRK